MNFEISHKTPTPDSIILMLLCLCLVSVSSAWQGRTLFSCSSWGYFMFTSPTLPMLLLWNVRRAEMSYTSLLANKDDISEFKFVFCISWRTEDVREANNTNGGGDIHWVQGLKKYYSLLIILSRRMKKNTEIWGKKAMRLKANNKTIFIFISFHFNPYWSSLMLFLFYLPACQTSQVNVEDVDEDIMLMRN